MRVGIGIGFGSRKQGTAVSGDVIAPTYEFGILIGSTITASVADETSTTLSLYHTVDQQGTAPTPAQVVAGLDSTGAAADFAQGPDSVVVGIVDISLDLSGLADGDYNLRGVSVDDAGHISDVDTLAFTKVTAFLDDFNRANEPLEASANWTQIHTAANGTGDVVTNKLVFQGDAFAQAVYLTADTKPENQYSQVEVAGITTGGEQLNIVVYARMSLPGARESGYAVLARGDTPSIALYKATEGALSILGSAVATQIQVGDVLRIETEGSTIRAVLNGTAIITQTDATFSGAGFGGLNAFLRASGGLLTLDNFEHGAL